TGHLDGGTLRLPFADVTLDDAQKRALSDGDVRDEVIVGIRPEHFEDASLIGEQSAHGVTSVAEGDRAKLWVDTSRMHFFQPSDGRALRTGRRDGAGRFERQRSEARAGTATEEAPA